MSADVTVNTGQITGSQDRGGTTWYQWSVTATVNGASGVFTFWYDSNKYSDAAEYARVWLEENPRDLGPISINDGNPGDPGDEGDPGEDRGDDGDDDGVLADGSTGSEFGDSV